MPIYVLVAALAVAASVPILWWALASDRRATSGKNARTALGAKVDAHQLVLEGSVGKRALMPALRGFGATLLKVTPVGWISSLQRRLMFAGHYGDTYALERTLVLKAVLGAAGFVIGILALGGLSGLQQVVFTVLFVATGFFIPDALVARRARQRQERIQLELPDTLDQVTMSVEAGLGFESALVRAGKAGSGPLAEEINRTLREIQLGIPRDQALRQMTERTDVPELESFVLAVTQSERYGIGIGQVLRVQSDEVRDKRRQRAEERALKIPVLLIFPLAFCIFPAVFIVILGPAAIRIFRDLGSTL